MEEYESELAKFTKFEKARIIGARALQLSMGAPLLLKRPEEMYDTVKIAEAELINHVLPITIRRPKPLKLEEREDAEIKEAMKAAIKAEEQEEEEETADIKTKEVPEAEAGED